MKQEDAADFFEKILTEEMEKLDFQHLLVRAYLVGILCSFCVPRGKEIYHVRRDQALAILVHQANMHAMMSLGERMLFGVGIFPEHFVASGKRRVNLDYYINMLEKVIARRLSQEFLIWDEICVHFQPTLKSLHRLRKRLNIHSSDVAKSLTVLEATGEFLG